eukprot:3761099-Amphidinium_carterae.1
MLPRALRQTEKGRTKCPKQMQTFMSCQLVLSTRGNSKQYAAGLLSLVAFAAKRLPYDPLLAHFQGPEQTQNKNPTSIKRTTNSETQ